jgi:hypothetical protein
MTPTMPGEKNLVANAHLVTHHVAGLVVADTVPLFAAVAFQIIDAVGIGLGFHQPIRHSFLTPQEFRGGEVYHATAQDRRNLLWYDDAPKKEPLEGPIWQTCWPISSAHRR